MAWRIYDKCNIFSSLVEEQQEIEVKPNFWLGFMSGV
jgi:hypothetical protein